MTNKQEIPWESIHFLIGTITYGGRVTDNNDLRLLISTMKRFLSQSLMNEKY